METQIQTQTENTCNKGICRVQMRFGIWESTRAIEGFRFTLRPWKSRVVWLELRIYIGCVGYIGFIGFRVYRV